MSPSNTEIVTPVGDLQFLALNRKVKKNKKPDSQEGYSARIKLDGTTKEGAEFRKILENINPALIGEKHIDKKGEYTVRAFSQFDVEVWDKNGDPMETRPNFFKNSTGKAQLVLQPDTRKKGEGSIYLLAVSIHEIDVGDQENTGISVKDRLTAIRANMKNATNSGL